MEHLDNIFKKRERKHRRNYEIENKLYVELEKLSLIYEATIADLVNTALEHMIKNEDIYIYKKDENEITVRYAVFIRESNIAGLEKLKEKYEISIFRLVNMAIHNMLKGMKAEDKKQL